MLSLLTINDMSHNLNSRKMNSVFDNSTLQFSTQIHHWLQLGVAWRDSCMWRQINLSTRKHQLQATGRMIRHRYLTKRLGIRWVLSHVQFQNIRPCKTLTAHLTFVGSLSRVQTHVDSQVAGLLGGLATDRTPVWLFPSVLPVVNVKLLLFLERLPTFLALVRFLACMLPAMTPQLGTLGKGSPTQVAQKRSLACVLSAVDFQCTCDIKCFTTKLTLKWLFTSVVAHVDFQVAFLCELCSTNFTLKSFYSKMPVSVPQQVVLFTEFPITQITCEWLLTCVLSSMHFQTSCIWKDLAA